MSSFDPIGEGDNPFEGLPPMFSDLAKFLNTGGALNWDVARQTALWAATEGQVEPNVDPLVRIKIEELLRMAELHVGEVTGRSVSITGQSVRAITVTRSEWATRALDAYRPMLEKLGNALTGTLEIDADDPDAPPGLVGGMAEMINPALVGIQSGMMAGHLAHRFFGQYDLPLPRDRSDNLLFVPVNIETFAHDWSLPLDDLELWVCLSQLAHHVVLGIDHVRSRITDLVAEYTSNFSLNPAALEEHMGSIDPADPESMQIVLDDPNAILGAIQTPQQEKTLIQLEALVCAIEGYVGWVVDQTATKLIASYGQLKEALLRRRVEETDGDRFVERLLGLSLGQKQYDRADAFIAGVVERAGEKSLNRLWEKLENLPTPNEVDAPGLWLARIDLPDD